MLKKLDVAGMLLSLIFIYGAFSGKMPMENGIKTGVLLFILSFLSLQAKKKPNRFKSFAAYLVFFFILCYLSTMNEIESYSLQDFLLVSAAISVVPFAFKWKARAITGAVIGYWLTLAFSVLVDGSTEAIFTHYTELSTSDAIYLMPVVGGFLLIGIIGFVKGSMFDFTPRPNVEVAVSSNSSAPSTNDSYPTRNTGYVPRGSYSHNQDDDYDEREEQEREIKEREQAKKRQEDYEEGIKEGNKSRDEEYATLKRIEKETEEYIKENYCDQCGKPTNWCNCDDVECRRCYRMKNECDCW